MKNRLPLIRTKLFLFLVITGAVVTGNLLSHLWLRQDLMTIQTEIKHTEQELLKKLDALEKNNEYQKRRSEFAEKEAARLQRSIEYHNQLMERARTTSSPSNVGSGPAPAP